MKITTLALALIPFALAAGAPDAQPRDAKSGGLTFADRIAAQRAIERVYYDHRIWPKENPNPKPSFETLVPEAAIESRADEPLRMSAVLKEYWNVELTPVMLQAEMDRMERDSKDRATLHELFAALGNDPFLIAENLARDNLAQQALRNHFAWEAKLHAESRVKAESLAARIRQGADWATLEGFVQFRVIPEDEGTTAKRAPGAERETGPLHLPREEWITRRDQLSSRTPDVFREEETGYRFERLLSATTDSLEAESLFIPKRSFDDWWAAEGQEARRISVSAVQDIFAFKLPEPGRIATGGCDSWDGAMKQPPPTARSSHTAVWTGSEMIVWGGGGPGNIVFNSGGRYNPATDSWLPTSVGTNLPAARFYHTAVWTGSEMIVWGGYDRSATPFLNSGGRYNPATDGWLPTLGGANLPAGRSYHTAVWTGSEMIVWGGSNAGGLNSGGRYNPMTGNWLPTPLGANLPAARSNHTAVWTGNEMIIWGGAGLNSGGRYNPATDSWLPTSVGANLPAARYDHTAVWTGSEMIVWGGYAGSTLYFNSGGRYNPATNSWLPTSVGANLPLGRSNHTAVWTGSEMIVWGGSIYTCTPSCGDVYYNTGGRYNPTTNSWLPTSVGSNLPTARRQHTAIWTGSEMIVWGGYDGSVTPYLNSGGRYNPMTDGWLPTSLGANLPPARYYHTAIWTGSEMVVWGGNNAANLNSGGRYSPATDSWLPTSLGVNLPAARGLHTAVWTGSEMIVWGGADPGGSNTLNSGGRYNPTTNNWLPTTLGANLPAARYVHTAVWTGSEMIVWGGYDGSATPYINSGGRYNPATDSWLPTSLGVNLPAARGYHTAVWTGSEMIVWGGAGPGALSSGGRYKPATDSWLPISNLPQARGYHTAVWTGSEMIVWGGNYGGPLNSGARYNPATNSWLPTSLGANLPAARDRHTAIWTGSEMIVWGGFDQPAMLFFNSGGRYNPATDSWLPTSMGANLPAVRGYHTAIWTGSEMIVWGGYDGSASPYLNSGGRYTSGTAASLGNSLRGSKSATVNLSWIASAGATSYNVKRCNPATACVPTTLVATPTANSYTEANDAVSHFYAIEAVNACGATQ